MTTPNAVNQIYNTVVEDVISNVREAFLDEGVDEQVLQELKQLWESKFSQSRALDPIPETEQVAIPQAIQYPGMLQQGLAQRINLVLIAGVQHIGLPVQLSSGGEISGSAAAAAMALPSGIFAHQLQALAAQGIIGSNKQVLSLSNGQIIVQGIQQGAGAATGHVISTTLPQTQHQTLQQIQTTAPGQGTILNTQPQIHQVNIPRSVLQLDGTNDTSSSEDEFDNDDNDDDNEDEHDEEDEQGEEEEPLNSGDDVSDEDPSELFDTDNVVVCQYDKINRNKNKWKFNLKDGIMNLNGRDYLFQKATGDSEW
ncbi:hypothetical protein ScPMuIL_014972 [Solemya velum]